MQVSNPNEIKIYNLSQGPTLPEWIANRKNKKDDLNFRRRIELIQDFEMPHITDGVLCTSDGHYIMTHGVYKPRIRCYDVRNLSMKFERCTDSEIIKMCMLSEDYSKPVLLQADRYVEFHAQYGRYYRTRIPKPGRDFLYHPEHCELYFVGATPEIHRLNLERGQFMKPLMSEGPEVNVCALNSFHHLFLCGTQDGKVEAWDPRDRCRAGVLDVAALSLSQSHSGLLSIPEVTSLAFKDALVYGVGTSAGHTLVLDLRADKPIVVKDQQNDLPVKKILFHKGSQWSDLVLSADSKILKLWRYNEGGRILTSVEPEAKINDVTVVDEDSGLILMPTETMKVQVYYIPSLGIAPKWCHFLDNLTEELEENPNPEVYDNYKFVTQTELESLGLSHLVGTPLLRAYMHGYFVDLRLYRKAKTLADPYAYEEYKREKVKEKIDDQRRNRVKLDQLPAVNKELARRMAELESAGDDVHGDESRKEKRKAMKAKKAAGVLADDRFQKMFQDPDFQIDQFSEEYKNIQPVVESMQRKVEKPSDVREANGLDDDDDSRSEESEDDDGDDSSSSDDDEFERKLKQKYKEKKMVSHQSLREGDAKSAKPTGRTAGAGVAAGTSSADVRTVRDVEVKKKKREIAKSLIDRVGNDDEDDDDVEHLAGGSRESTFVPSSSQPRPPPKNTFASRRQELKEAEYKRRKKERRGAGGVLPKPKLPPKFYMGKRVQ